MLLRWVSITLSFTLSNIFLEDFEVISRHEDKILAVCQALLNFLYISTNQCKWVKYVISHKSFLSKADLIIE